MSKVTMADAIAAGDGVILNELEGRIQELETNQKGLVKALEWYAGLAKDLNLFGAAGDMAEIYLRRDRGKRAMEAIAKAKGEDNE